MQRHPLAVPLIKHAKVEPSLYWNDPDTGILCKCRPDLLRHTLVADLKTTKDASPRAFQKDVLSYGYHLQAVMIQAALQVLNGVEMNHFWFIVIEKEPPYLVAVYQLDDAALAEGRARFKQLLHDYQHCLSTQDWLAYPVQTISLPAYAFHLSGE